MYVCVCVCVCVCMCMCVCGCVGVCVCVYINYIHGWMVLYIKKKSKLSGRALVCYIQRSPVQF